MVKIVKQTDHGFFYNSFGFKSTSKIYAFLIFLLIILWLITYCAFSYLKIQLMEKDLFFNIFEALITSFLVLVGVSKAEIFSGAFKSLVDKG